MIGYSGHYLANQLHLQNYSKLYQKTQIEVLPNFYVLRFMPWTSKIRVNILLEKLLVEHLRNWPLGSISPNLFAKKKQRAYVDEIDTGRFVCEDKILLTKKRCNFFTIMINLMSSRAKL